MRDNVMLKDVITSPDENQREIFHLVCQRLASVTPDTPNTESRPANGEEVQEGATETAPPSRETAHASSPDDSGVRYRGASGQYPDYSQYYSYYQWPSQYANTNNQMQMYYWQMYASHMAAAAAAAAAAAHSGHSASPAPAPNSAPSRSEPAQAAAAQRNDGDGAGEPQQNAAPAANVAGNFMVDEEDDMGPRDWLDRLYAMVRFGFVLTIFFFYCSPTRFALLVLFSILVMLYQGGYLRLQRARAVRAPQAPPPAAAAAPADEDSDGDADEGTDAPASDRPGVFSIVFGNILAFFTSLIPVDMAVGN